MFVAYVDRQATLVCNADDADLQRRRAINCILFARRLFVAN